MIRKMRAPGIRSDIANEGEAMDVTQEALDLSIVQQTKYNNGDEKRRADSVEGVSKSEIKLAIIDTKVIEHVGDFGMDAK